MGSDSKLKWDYNGTDEMFCSQYVQEVQQYVEKVQSLRSENQQCNSSLVALAATAGAGTRVEVTGYNEGVAAASAVLIFATVCVALMLGILLFRTTRALKRVRRMENPDFLEKGQCDDVLPKDHAAGKIDIHIDDAGSATLEAREAATLVMEQRIIILGEQLLERALDASCWAAASEVDALREWTLGHAELTAEIVLEAALRRLDMQMAKESGLHAKLQDLEMRLPHLQREHALEVATSA